MVDADRAVLLAIGTGDASRIHVTDDGGATWDPVTPDATPSGHRSGSAWVTGLPRTVVAVGPNGSDVSHDAGHTWQTLSTTGFHAVECGRAGACWAAGSGGRIASMDRG